MRDSSLSLLAFAALLFPACGDAPGSAPNAVEAGHTGPMAPEVGQDPHTDAGHAHTAPRGGLLVVLAGEVAHAELLLDAEQGRLDVHLLGPHAEMPMRCPQETLTIELHKGSQAFELELAAVESALSGDQIGACSHYAATDARLVGLQELRGELGAFGVLGRRFPAARFPAEDSK